MNLQNLLDGIEADLVSAAADGPAALHAEAFSKLAALQFSPADLEATLLALHELGESKTAAFGLTSDNALRTVALGSILAAPAMSAMKFLHDKHQKEEGWSRLTATAPDLVGKDPTRARAVYDLLHSTSPALSGNTVVATDLMRQMLAAPQLDVGSVGRLAQTGHHMSHESGDSLMSNMSEGIRNAPALMLGAQSLQRGMPVGMPKTASLIANHRTIDGVPTFFDWGSEACKQAGLTDMFMGSGQPLDQANNASQMQQLDLGQTHLPLDNIIRELLAKETELTQREEIIAQQEQQMQQWQQAMQQMGGMYQGQTGVDPSTGQPVQDPAAMGGEDPSAMGGEEDPAAMGGEDPSAMAGGDVGAPPEEGMDPNEGAIAGDPNAEPDAGQAGNISDEGSQQIPPPDEAQAPPEGSVGTDAAQTPGGAPEGAGQDPSVSDLVQPQGGEMAEDGENPASPVGIDSTPGDVAAGDAVPGGTVDTSASPIDGEEGGEAPPVEDGEAGGEAPPVDDGSGEAPPIEGGEEGGEAPPADGSEEGGEVPPVEGGELPPGGDEEAPVGEEGQPPADGALPGEGGEPAPADDGMALPPATDAGGDAPPEAGVVSAEEPPMDPAAMQPQAQPAAAPVSVGQGGGTATIPVTFTLPMTVSIKVGSHRTDFDDAVDQHRLALSQFASKQLSLFH